MLVVVAETVVGATTGALAAPKGYFKAMKSVCEKYGALFILDEVSKWLVAATFYLHALYRSCAEWVVSPAFVQLLGNICVTPQEWVQRMHGSPLETVLPYGPHLTHDSYTNSFLLQPDLQAVAKGLGGGYDLRHIALQGLNLSLVTRQSVQF